MAADTSAGPASSGAARSPVDASRMPLVEHLRELRNRMGWSLLTFFVVVVVVGVFFWEPLFDFIKKPYTDTPQGQAAPTLFSFTPLDQLSVRLRVSAVAAAVISSPVWLYHIGAFITPALHKNERKYVFSFLAASLILFGAGATLAYVTVSQGLAFLLDVGGDGITNQLRIDAYLGFFSLTLLAFGVAFEFPVVVTFLNFVGVFPSTKMRAWRRGMIFFLFVFAALITPSQDPIGMTVLGATLVVLYEICILIARLRERALRKRRLQEPDAQLDDDAPSYVDPRPSAID